MSKRIIFIVFYFGFLFLISIFLGIKNHIYIGYVAALFILFLGIGIVKQSNTAIKLANFFLYIVMMGTILSLPTLFAQNGITRHTFMLAFPSLIIFFLCPLLSVIFLSGDRKSI